MNACRLGMLSGVAAMAISSSAMAQTATAPAPQPGEIVVTAQFREQRLQDTPLAITAINAATLEARGQVSITDIAAQAPNVTLRPAAATFGPSIQAFIRGVGQYDSSYAFEPGVGMYVDDVYYSTLTGSLLDLMDLDRVEVLRGPQGTLSGQNSIGGSVKLYSRKPRGDSSGFLQVTGGSFNRIEARGALDFALVPDKLMARISATGVRKDGYVTRYDYACTHPGTTVPSFQTAGTGCKLGTQGGKAYQAVRGALRWMGSDRLEVNLSADYTNDNSEAAPSTLLFVGTAAGVPGVPNATSAYQIGGVALGNATGSPFITSSPYGAFAQDSFTNSPYVNYATYTNPAPRDGTAPYTVADRSTVNGGGGSLMLDYRLGENMAFKSITAARGYVARYIFDEGTPVDTALIDNYNRLSQFSQELRLSGRVLGSLNYTLGGFYLEYQARTRQRVDIPSLQFIEDDRITQHTRAGFLNLDWQASGALNVVGGLRYTQGDKTVTYGRLGIPGSIYGGLADPRVRSLDGIVGRHEGDHWDYRLALQYRWSPALMTYAQVSTGFREGGVNPRAFFPQQALPFGSETLTAYELGLKADLFDRRLRFNLSGFYNKYDNILVIVSACPLAGAPAAPCALPVNAGKADVKGVEAETTLRLAKGLTVEASLAYLDFRYTALSSAAIASGVSLDMRGPFTPRWQYSLGAQYEGALGAAGTLTPRVDLSHVDAFYAQPTNTAYNVVPGRTLVNASLTWRSAARGWSVTAALSNLTNKVYYNTVFDNRGSNSTVTGNPAPPREWSLSVKRSF
ncbi:iron complex outermembrane receptor protein [Novosphingobium sp. SG751A]|uniref:TonB-dependent receptor n=1 Tax=Novosphingobium sp. SG751A TaxID=2587000 RepID=UPI00155679D9|nr:TonB-dependent receptor [Novosphingobium sp. SG751A]NOW47976.1 iron complex outermembrane receptor protein [Novosphingobium sp. SG751A]